MQNSSVPFSSVTNDLAFSRATRFTKSILALCKQNTRHTAYKPSEFQKSTRKETVNDEIFQESRQVFQLLKRRPRNSHCHEKIHLQMLLHACILYVSKFSRPRLHITSIKKNIKERCLYKVQTVWKKLILQMI